MKEYGHSARYQVIPEAGGSRYRFFCELSGIAVCTTRPIRAETPAKALQLAWEGEGKLCFNRCGKCGRWVSDVMFNVDTLECVECSPWEEPPNFCPHCGAAAKSGRFCPRCGGKLQYEEG